LLLESKRCEIALVLVAWRPQSYWYRNASFCLSVSVWSALAMNRFSTFTLELLVCHANAQDTSLPNCRPLAPFTNGFVLAKVRLPQPILLFRSCSGPTPLVTGTARLTPDAPFHSLNAA